MIVSLAINVYQWNTNTATTSQSGKEEMANLLIHAEAAINAELLKLDGLLLDACQKLSTTGLTGPQAETVLNDLYAQNSALIVNAATADKNGIIVAVQPSQFSNIIGQDVKSQEQNIHMYETMRPALSNIITLVQGNTGIVMVSPVFNTNGQFIGHLSIVFQPYQLMHPILYGPANGTHYTIYALQTNGTLIYDENTEEQGKNIFTDAAYTGHTELLTFIHQVVNTQSGYGTYSFFDDKVASKPLVSKEAYWTTIGIYNTAWRLVIAQPMNP